MSYLHKIKDAIIHWDPAVAQEYQDQLDQDKQQYLRQHIQQPLAMADAISIIICGRREVVGKPIIEGLKPQFEGMSTFPSRVPHTYDQCLTTQSSNPVVHFCLTEESALSEIPLVVQGKKPPTQSSHIGSGNYDETKKPMAVVLGAGYDSTLATALIEAIKTHPVPVFEVDRALQKDMPPLGKPEYGQRMVERVVEGLHRVRDEGKLVAGYGGLHLY
jgi:hypothetical protein